MIKNIKYRQGSMCQTYGHNWRKVQHGKYQCSNCKAVAYCPGCLLSVPKGAATMRCEIHKREVAR